MEVRVISEADRMLESRSDNTDAGMRKVAAPGTLPPKRRQTYYIQPELVEKIRAYAYWEREGISEVVNMALEEFFWNKDVKEMPERNQGVSRRNNGKS